MKLAAAVAAGPKKRGAKKQPKLNKDGTEKQPRKPSAYNAWMQGKVCRRACRSPPELARLPCVPGLQPFLCSPTMRGCRARCAARVVPSVSLLFGPALLRYLDPHALAHAHIAAAHNHST